jgi:3-hydroxyacyl-[acyl-carrier-protein] dehydratase
MTLEPLCRAREAAPHRYPMRLVDRLVVLTPNEYGCAIKAISLGETHGEGAAWAARIPRTLIVDALGQVAIMVLNAARPESPAIWYLASIDAMSFTGDAAAGDLLRLEATVQRTWRTTSKIAVRASVDGRMVGEGSLVLASRRRAG